MENSLSTPHCSFVINLHRDLENLPRFLQDFRIFFQRFPLRYELVGVIHPSQQKSISILETLQQSAPENEVWHIVTGPPQSRALSLRRALDSAQGEVILTPSIVMSTPLGDLFKMMQTLLAEPTVAACWGERYSKNHGALHQLPTAALRLEKVFNDIFKEKFPQREKDSLCEAGALRKSAWLQIRDSASVQKARGWYLAAACQHALREQALVQKTVFVNDSGQRPQDFSLWKARWELLRQSLFQAF